MTQSPSKWKDMKGPLFIILGIVLNFNMTRTWESWWVMRYSSEFPGAGVSHVAGARDLSRLPRPRHRGHGAVAPALHRHRGLAPQSGLGRGGQGAAAAGLVAETGMAWREKYNYSLFIFIPRNHHVCTCPLVSWAVSTSATIDSITLYLEL